MIKKTRVELDNSLVRCAHSWAIELNTRREILYLRALMYYSLFLDPNYKFMPQRKIFYVKFLRLSSNYMETFFYLLPSETLKECIDESCSLFSSVRFKQVRMSTSFRIKTSGSWSYVTFTFARTEPQTAWWMKKIKTPERWSWLEKRAFA